MITDGRTLVVVADGARARLFEEARRGGPLTEHEADAPADRLSDDAEALRGHVQALRLKGA